MNINPHLLKIAYTKVVIRNQKAYRPTLIYFEQRTFTHRAFFKAKDAEHYARRIVERWKRLYGWAQKAKIDIGMSVHASKP